MKNPREESTADPEAKHKPVPQAVLEVFPRVSALEMAEGRV